MATMKSSLTTKVPAPKMQGGHGSSDATTQKTKIQSKASATKAGPTTQLFTKQPSGTRGTGTNAGKPMK